jgi:hypothetical protein
MAATVIVLRYSSVDGYRDRRSFKTLAGARKFALDHVGPQSDPCGRYAISDDGIGKIEVVDGITLRELFAAPAPKKAAPATPQDDDDDCWPDPDEAYERHLESRYAGRDNLEAEAHGRYEDVV